MVMPGGEPMYTLPLVEHSEPAELLEPTEVVRGRDVRWLQVGGVLLLGGEPTVNTTGRGLAPPAAKPQVPAGAVSMGLSVLRLSVLPWYGCPPKVIRTGCSDSLPALTDLPKEVLLASGADCRLLGYAEQ